MRPSVVIKKIFSVAALGLAIYIAVCSSAFFALMGYEFGYQDLRCKSFPETRKFAVELENTLQTLENSAYWLENNEIQNKHVTMVNLSQNGGEVYPVRENTYRMRDWLMEQDYYYSMDKYGIQEVFMTGNENYNDEWYSISLNPNEVKNASTFYVMSREDYIALLLSYARLNSDGADNVTMEAIEMKSGDEIDAAFSPNSYVGYYEGLVFVYSPEEEMFYSSMFGWYTIPDYLYFTEGELSGIEYLFCPFTSREMILKQKVGKNYLDYVKELENLTYDRRSIAYYTVSDAHRYSNVEDLETLQNCNMSMCIKRTASGEYAVEFCNFENVYMTDEYVTGLMERLSMLKPDDTLYIGIYTTFPYDDAFSESNKMFNKYYSYTITALLVAIATITISIVMFIQCLRKCGRATKNDQTVYLNVIDKIPVEIMMIAILLGGAMLVLDCKNQLFMAEYYRSVDMLAFNTCFVIGYSLLITGVLSLVRRAKKRQMFVYSLIRWSFRLTKRLINAVSHQKNLVARAVELFLLYWLIMLLGIGALSSFGWLRVVGLGIIVAVNVVAFVLLLRQAKGEQSIRDATKALADGNLEYQGKSIKCLGTEQEIMDNIEHMSDGLQKVVEKSIYDERMKAELITNVSHDIKTPLTSIINYVDLMKREEIDNEKLLHYIEVLDRKSWRLKQLTEDLVEVSKITTGNIELERIPIDFGELLRQVLGEFEDKFTEHELQIVDTIQEEAYMIFADGRRTFRVLDNLFQNVYKYAMPKTRVYVDIINEQGRIELSIKNISKAPLNIDAKELMERFVRGDQSRTTEGSGLGLSIAQDLVKLQDGEFRIYLDGDLFKVVIAFPEYVNNEIIDMKESE